MSAPAGIDIVVKGQVDAVSFLKAQDKEKKRLIILVKAPATIAAIVEKRDRD